MIHKAELSRDSQPNEKSTPSTATGLSRILVNISIQTSYSFFVDAMSLWYSTKKPEIVRVMSLPFIELLLKLPLEVVPYTLQ
jgi:hypothetical protein